MKITKEERSLYNFLKQVAHIFSKSSHRTLIFGNRNTLYFHTFGYSGKFTHKDNDETLLNEYDFGERMYELKQLPNGEYVLDSYDSESVVAYEEKIHILEDINESIDYKQFCCQMEKDHDTKISELVSSSGLWLRDNDVRYLNAFPEITVFYNKHAILVHSEGVVEGDQYNVDTFIIIETTPKEDMYTKQKIMFEEPKVVLLKNQGMDDLERELDDDPMA